MELKFFNGYCLIIYYDYQNLEEIKNILFLSTTIVGNFIIIWDQNIDEIL